MTGKKILDVKVRYHILHPEDVFQFSSDGSYLIHINPSNEIILTELASGKMRQSISDPGSGVNDIALSDDHEWLAAGLSDGTIKLWNNPDNKDYKFFRIIRAHKESVWSVDFPENSNFILSASADSSYSIWDFNGGMVYGSSYWGYPEQKEFPYCKAVFRGNDKAIVLTAYEYQEKAKGIGYTYYMQVDFSSGSQGYLFGYNSYNGEAGVDLFETLKNDRFDKNLKYFDYSPDGYYYVLSYSDRITSNIYFADGLNLKILQGTKPVFSNDGKYIICTENNRIHLYPAVVSEMIRLVLEEKIFGPIIIELPE
jgi:WD40 repeat protein